MIQPDFNIVFWGEGGVFVVVSAFKSFILKLDMGLNHAYGDDVTQVVTTSISVNISPIQDYILHHIPPTYEMTPGFKPFTVLK